MPADPPRRRSRLGLQAAILLGLVGAALWIWRSELFHVAAPGDRPRPLAASAGRPSAAVDVVLPAVPAGMRRLRSGGGALLIHYWAPWERHANAQIQGLDSLRRHPELQRLSVVVVCFDPFPSVARYVARRRLRLPVLLDPSRDLRERLPCPRIPYTYVLDARGRIAVAQAGEVDWWSPATLAALRDALGEPPPLASGGAGQARPGIRERAIPWTSIPAAAAIAMSRRSRAGVRASR